MTSIARSWAEPAPSLALDEVDHERTRRSDRTSMARALYTLFVFACFFPYPAIAIGTNNGLQISQVLTLGALPLLAVRPVNRGFLALIIVLVPLYVSAFLNSFRLSTPDSTVLLKEAVSASLALMIIWPAVLLADRSRFREALTLAAIATVIHSLIGLYQAYAFSNDEFPLLWLYRNPSFKPMESWSDLYAKYVKRPCGIFPEPSAMASALGPWLVLLTARLAGRIPGVSSTRRETFLTSAAVVGGFVLLAMSRSGSVVAVIGGVLLGLLGGGGKGRARYLPVMIIGAAGIGVVGFVVSQVSSNLDARIETSWGLRGQSIVAAMTGNTEVFDLIFGVGPGQSSTIVQRMLSGIPIPKDQGDVAVWSLAASYYMDNGWFGGCALLLVLGWAVLAISRSSTPLLGFGSLASWVVAVVVTTSYMALPSVWLFLGVALSWDRLFPTKLSLGSSTE